MLDLAATEPVVGLKVISDASRGASLRNLLRQVPCPQPQREDLVVLSAVMCVCVQ
jgi:hypothetical protein